MVDYWRDIVRLYSSARFILYGQGIFSKAIRNFCMSIFFLWRICKFLKVVIYFCKVYLISARNIFFCIMCHSPQIHLEGATDFQCVVSYGGQPCMGGHLCMEPPCTAVSAIVTNKQMSTDAKHTVNDPRGTPSMQTDLFERWDRLPMCSFWWRTVMHGRTPVMEPHVSLSSLSKPNE